LGPDDCGEPIASRRRIAEHIGAANFIDEIDELAANVALRGDAIAADISGMLAKYVGLTVAATGFAVAFAAVFGRRPALLRGRR
jgi:hypothetical protein